jgi:ABC-type multidrug transport system fused ATPase/permease subunit
MGRSLLMRVSGQRIVAQLRRHTYASALKQEVDYIERAEGDVLSRLSADTSIVGESGELTLTVLRNHRV